MLKNTTKQAINKTVAQEVHRDWKCPSAERIMACRHNIGLFEDCNNSDNSLSFRHGKQPLLNKPCQTLNLLLGGHCQFGHNE
jgi:hypothetical protein